MKRSIGRLVKQLKQKVPTEGHRKTQRLERLRELGVLQMGTGSYGEPEVLVWWDDAGNPIGGKVRVGAYVSIAGQVQIFTGGNHVKERVTTFPVRQIYGLAAHGEDEHPQTNGDVVIGNDVWIAQSAIILSGITIGDGAIVAAGAVVAKDVRPYAIVAGNPARELARRFDDDTVDELLRLAWWDRPEAWVREHADLLCQQPDLPALRAALGRTDH